VTCTTDIRLTSETARPLSRSGSTTLIRIDLIKQDEEHDEKPSYILVEELKSVREAYIRVAVIVDDIIEGIMNIYIGGREEDGRKKPVASAAHNEENTPYRGELIFGAG
jgi:hypothetical protein